MSQEVGPQRMRAGSSNPRSSRVEKAVVVLLGILAFSDPSLAQSDKFNLTAKKTTNPPVIDGVVNEEEWKNAPTVNELIQFVPVKGEPASVNTVVKLLYDDDYIYIGFLCVDPTPDKIQLGANRRDSLSSRSGTDSVTTELDTFNDDRTMYYFRTNPLGVQHDGRVSDNGLVADEDWDGIWKSAGAWTEDGWSAEMAIPLTTVRFEAGENQTWGLQFSRYYPRNFEKSFWTGPFEDYKKVSVNGALTGLDFMKSQKRLEIIPHAISRVQQGEGAGFSGGLDASYALSQSISGFLTVNPDFATVEADREQVNLTRFELSLPEKRNFFLDGNDVYRQRIRLFYSRRVSDIFGGLRTYGKTGAYEISAITSQTKNDGVEQESSANFSVFRMKRDIMESSNVGFLAANKHVDGRNQGTFGTDTTLYFNETASFTGQLAMSYGDRTRSDLAFFLRPSYDTRTFHGHFRFTHLGQYFGDNANAVGFIPDDNRNELDSAITKTYWMNMYQPPFGMVQLAYQKGTARFGEAGTQGHTLFVKFAYVFERGLR